MEPEFIPKEQEYFNGTGDRIEPEYLPVQEQDEDKAYILPSHTIVNISTYLYDRFNLNLNL